MTKASGTLRRVFQVIWRHRGFVGGDHMSKAGSRTGLGMASAADRTAGLSSPNATTARAHLAECTREAQGSAATDLCGQLVSAPRGYAQYLKRQRGAHF